MLKCKLRWMIEVRVITYITTYPAGIWDIIYLGMCGTHLPQPWALKWKKYCILMSVKTNDTLRVTPLQFQAHIPFKPWFISYQIDSIFTLREQQNLEPKRLETAGSRVLINGQQTSVRRTWAFHWSQRKPVKIENEIIAKGWTEETQNTAVANLGDLFPGIL